MEPSNDVRKDQIQGKNIPKRKDDYRLEQLDDELLLYHPSDTKILYLNQSASLVWGLCDGQHSVAEIVQLLSEAYPEAAENIPDDVRATLEQFLESGCIELVEA
ncbi:MAG: PqqD family protein [Anaerolineales bacterium]|nr:PqqD family protein [Anaerolineales bacterium]